MDKREEKILVFSLEEEYYAADIMEVERILGYQTATTLPEAPDYVKGVINYEGSILPIISLRRRFNLEDKIKAENKIIVVKKEDFRVGIIVDMVIEVSTIDISSLENPLFISNGISKKYIKGIIKDKDRIIVLLNLSEILTNEEKALVQQGI